MDLNKKNENKGNHWYTFINLLTHKGNFKWSGLLQVIN